ncbi:septin-7-like isoform X3 [Denticeps clupeoides]|uniref:septin-7-like isoform X3 n=1 Tax=Denticeps clupeoides TaxID=299321 RepID=UPI0010A3DC73|nr:septin-7-like isoform X3 [Denticeps clupeoides]
MDQCSEKEKEKAQLGKALAVIWCELHCLHDDISFMMDMIWNRNPEDKEEVLQRNLEGYVGFANLPNQVYRKSVKRGFEFTLMVVGESGLGKSTLINSLFLTDLYSKDYPGPSQRIKKTVQVEQSKVLVKEGGVQLTLTIVDTPGFGDAVDNSNCWQPVINYIDSKCEDFLNAESRVNRRLMPDSRVHCCLYFISPSGHGLKPLDIEFMKRLHDKVNVIPLIAKADTLTPEECQLFKKQIMKEIQEHSIKIYEFPDTEDDEDNKLIRKVKERMPLAVVGSNIIVEVNGRKVRGRQYPWGVAEVENGEHCDFTVLRNMLIRTHMQDLKDVTNNVHYENYRSRKLAAVTCNGGDTSKTKGQLTKSPLAQMEEERREHVMKMKKMEAEMEQVFEMKVKEKKQKLKDSEAELERRHEQMKKNLDAQYRELEEKRRQFDEEKVNWEAQQRMLEQQKLDVAKTMEKNKKKGKIF